MAASDWDVDFSGFDVLLERCQKLPDRAEKIINETLRNESGPTAVKAIDSDTPVSKTGLRQGHRHAKGANEYQVSYNNLGFVVRPKKKFDYLKYPDLGIGTSINNAPQNFLNTGLNKSVVKIVDQLVAALDNNLMK